MPRGLSAKEITQGTTLEGPHWPEPVRVLAADVQGRWLSLEAVGIESQRYYNDTYDAADLHEMRVHASDGWTFEGDADHFRLALEARRIGLAYEYDPHFGVSLSQIEPLPHQLTAVYDYILPRPRIRFMLADDPGAGKTIMAGLVVKELRYRRALDRVLIVVPAKLIRQWQRELEERFGERFVHIDRATLQAHRGRNAWRTNGGCITSIDFAKQDDVMDTLRDADWDMVIVDEAHKMAAYRYGNKLDKTDRYRLGELLAPRTQHLLFLTATPHKGDPDNFLLLLQLLDPDLYANQEILEQAVRNDENPIFLRRMKEQMKGFDGKPLFPPRHPRTVAYHLSPPEHDLYEAVTHYVEDGFQRAYGDENRHVQLALLVLQRRVASSVRAIRTSLERRHDRLREMRRLGQAALRGDHGEIDWETLEDLPEAERWRLEDDAVARHTVARTLGELDQEIKDLEYLVRLARQAESAGTERKLQELHGVMEDENLFYSDEKLLIFTEAKDTLDYLVENLQRWGVDTVQIHGGMNMDQRIEAEERFRRQAQVMVATEAAGEGINLQFCHLMVNYDIPWNPNRLAQRMGRIHRYGQDREVYIFNLVATDTREGEVVARLLEKLEDMRQDLGHDAVFDVIDEISQGQSLEELFRQALSRRKTFDQILAEVDAQFDPANRELVQRVRLEGLATEHIDLRGVEEREQRAQESRLVPAYIEHFFVDAWRALGYGSLNRRQDGRWTIDYVPAELRRDGTAVAEAYRGLTFRKPEPDGERGAFMVPGHPLFEALRRRVEERFGPALERGTVLYDPQGREGYLWLLEGAVRDGRPATVGRRLYAIFKPAEGPPREWPLTRLLDLETDATPDDARPDADAPSEGEGQAIIGWALDHCLEPYYRELCERRQRETEITQRYLRKSFQVRISASQRKLIDYAQRRQQGADMDLAIQQEERTMQELQQERERRLETVAREAQLSREVPRVVGLAAIRPLPQPEGGMHRDAEVERVAMEVAMAYERQQGRQPEDVADQNLGFDLRSRDAEGETVRRIEVKGRAGTGAVRLSPNEWLTAKNLGDAFWLYIVVHCAHEPQLHVIQDPAARIDPDEELTITGYQLGGAAWRRVAEPTNLTYEA